MGLFYINLSLRLRVDQEQKNFRLERILIYVNDNLASRLFKRVALIACIVIVAVKQ